MDGNYFLFYAEANIFCILIFGILLLNDHFSVNKQEKQIVFDRALVAHVLYFVTDIFWAGTLAGALPRTRFAVAILNFGNYFLLSAIAFEWAFFAGVSERMPFLGTKRGRTLFRLPYIIMTTLILVAYFVAPRFWINEKCELNVLYYPLMLAAPLFYVIFSCVFSLKNANKSEDPAERKLFRTIGLYPLTVVFFGVFQLAFLNAPLFCFGCTTMMLFFYIHSMNGQISLDPLTKINNRGQLLRYALQEKSHRREDTKTFVVMADANNFKSINDNYGHAEGDRALVMIANAMKSCSKAMRYSSCLSRYGGDEFAIIVHADQPAEVEQLVRDIRRNLLDSSASAQTPYSLTVSVGFDEWDVEQESFHDCLKRADAKLYEDKKRKKERVQVVS